MAKTDPHARMTHEAHLRFYAELNDFLPAGPRQRDFRYRFAGTPSVRDTIDRSEAVRLVPLQVFLVYLEFKRCVCFGRSYWRGSHLERLDRIVERARASGRRDPPDEDRTRRGCRVLG